MNNGEILKKAIEQAQNNGLRLHFSRREVYENIFNKEMPFWVGSALIFWLPFAKALDYKLADLGAWCDEGKDPFEYLRQFLDN